jgi:YbgC/YbaW family acyl-CoA thioester hydrolase
MKQIVNYVDTYKTVITLHHLDFMGHVNNATYLQLMEEARWHFYNSYGYTKEMVTKEKKGPIILEIHVKYRKEILLNEIVTIKTFCLEYSGILGKMFQTIYKENGKKSCQAELVFGMFDLQKRRLINPRGFWKDIHTEMLKHNIQISNRTHGLRSTL